MSTKVSLKFIATDSDKVNDLPIVSGQIIFSRDNKTIYLDTDQTRDAYSSIILLPTEETRIEMQSPVTGYFFVEETAVLWRYTPTNGWIQLTIPPSELIVFDEYEHFPQEGRANTLYVDNDTMYVWSSEEDSYVLMNAQK